MLYDLGKGKMEVPLWPGQCGLFIVGGLRCKECLAPLRSMICLVFSTLHLLHVKTRGVLHVLDCFFGHSPRVPDWGGATEGRLAQGYSVCRSAVFPAERLPGLLRETTSTRNGNTGNLGSLCIAFSEFNAQIDGSTRECESFDLIFA